jgi:hypothetical protein
MADAVQALWGILVVGLAMPSQQDVSARHSMVDNARYNLWSTATRVEFAGPAGKV